ncbi:DUF3987 domain-containing protein [Brevibacillus sp. NRS-1366]|uniref:phage NrS-1 polymerase family protein n=1 Tax=Brevibacillus sp. NRS-1366 TaxID=3233899 RepID=UPI003D1A2F2F
MGIEKIPEELRQRPQWVLWKLEKRGEKQTKIPYQTNGRQASVKMPGQWTSFHDALDVFQRSNSKYDGLGYVFSTDDPFLGIDLDNCVVDGKLTNEAKHILINLNSYTERSQSKNGVHVIVKAKMPGERNRISDYEMYDRLRFFVVTGDHVGKTPQTIEERQPEIDTLYERLFNKPLPQRQLQTTTMEDQDILSVALKSKSGEKIASLYSGDWSGYNSQSEADQALCNMLAFYTKDPEQIERLIMGSGLMRDKWERDDYRQKTINKALADVTEHYKGTKKAANVESTFSSTLPQSGGVDEQEFDFLLETPAEWDGKLGEAALHGLAGEVVRLIEPHTEADPAALLINFLTIFANIVGTEPHFVVSGGEHRMKVFSVLVGPTFRGKKGTSLEPVMKLMRAVDPELVYRTASGLSSGEGVIYAVRDPKTERVPIYDGEGKKKKPTGEYEEVITDPGVEDKRLLIVESEFGGVLNVLRRDGNTLSAIIRNAWDGSGDIRTLTKNPMSATNTHISILGHITPEELRKLLTGNEIYNGFVNRFLWLYVQQSKSLPSGGEFHKVDVGPIVQKIRETVNYANSHDALYDHQPMERDKAANALWERIYEPLQRDAAGIIGAATSRVIPYVMRLSCIYALLDKTHTIRVEHLRAAIAVWEYCYKSVQFIFGEQTLQHDPFVKRILEALQTREEGMSATDIYSGVFKRNNAESMKSALKKMVENGLIYVETVSTGKGRPKQIYRLNQSGKQLAN